MKRFLCWVVSSPLLLCIPNFIPHFIDLYIYLCFDSHILCFFWVREVDGIGEGSNFKDPSGFQKFPLHLWPGAWLWTTLEKFGWFYTKLWNQDPHSLVAWCAWTQVHHLVSNLSPLCTNWLLPDDAMCSFLWLGELLVWNGLLACFATGFVQSIAEWNAWFLDPWNGYTYWSVICW
jgi:hypothetical protein